MSEFDQLKNDAEGYAKDHPEQVQKAEQEAENFAKSKLGGGADQGQDDQQQDDQQGGDQQGADQEQ